MYHTLTQTRKTMTKLTVAHFLKFVNAQDKSQTINHEGWGDCAIGDFARSTCTTLESSVDIDIYGLMLNNPDYPEFNHMGQYRYWCLGLLLGEGEVLASKYPNVPTINTYGELQQAIRFIKL